MNLNNSVIDLNTLEKDDSGNDLIPDNTIVEMSVEVQPGDEGPNGLLTASANPNSDVVMLVCIFTVLSGSYSGRSFYQNFMCDGGKRDKHGKSICGMRGLQRIRAMLDSGHNIRPEDNSDEAKKKRIINRPEDINGLTVWGVIGIEKDKTEQYPDKNVVKSFLTPGMEGYGKAPAAESSKPDNS